MIDSKARKFLDPLIDKTADFLIKVGLSANQTTWIAFIIGSFAALLVYLELPLIAVTLLWTSGFLDSVDGSIARKNNNASSWGTVLDITFDRIVEILMIISLALIYPSTHFLMMILLSSIIISMTIFLTVGTVSKNEGIKSFYYQAGFAERTEGFIFLTFMTLFPARIIFFIGLFAAAILFTAGQRILEARKILN